LTNYREKKLAHLYLLIFIYKEFMMDTGIIKQHLTLVLVRSVKCGREGVLYESYANIFSSYVHLMLIFSLSI